MATMTAAEHREQAKARYDAFLAACPSQQLLDRISNKWVTLILAALGNGSPQQLGADCAGEPRAMRYSELARLLAGVSQKMLTQTLRGLERDGLLERRVYAVVPPKVEYTLTDLGRSLAREIAAIRSWAYAHMDEIDAARQAHDARVDLPAVSGRAP